MLIRTQAHPPPDARMRFFQKVKILQRSGRYAYRQPLAQCLNYIICNP